MKTKSKNKADEIVIEDCSFVTLSVVEKSEESEKKLEILTRLQKLYGTRSITAKGIATARLRQPLLPPLEQRCGSGDYWMRSRPMYATLDALCGHDWYPDRAHTGKARIRTSSDKGDIRLSILGQSEDLYPRSYGHFGTRYCYCATVHSSAHRALYIGGLLTAWTERTSHPRVLRAAWWQEIGGKGREIFSLTEGWILGKEYHSTAASLPEALAEYRQSRAARVSKKVEKRSEADMIEMAKKIFVGIDHALAAGNCRPGCDSFASRVISHLGAEVGAIRGDLLLQLADLHGVSIYAQRTLLHAAKQKLNIGGK